MNYQKIKTFFIFCVLCTLPAIPTIAGKPSSVDEKYEVFFRANQVYRESNYEKAASAYERLMLSGTVSGSLLYNIGNCYVRMNRMGKAILNYERAKRFMPRDPDLDFNLRYARDRIEDSIEGSPPFSPFQWLNTLSRSEVFWSFALINLLFWVTLILRLWARSEWIFYILIGLSLLWGISGISAGMKWYQETHDLRGVVTSPKISVHAGPDERDTTLFELHAGTIVICEREEGGWRLIRLTPEKRGWTKAESVERIIAPQSIALMKDTPNFCVFSKDTRITCRINNIQTKGEKMYVKEKVFPLSPKGGCYDKRHIQHRHG